MITSPLDAELRAWARPLTAAERDRAEEARAWVERTLRAAMADREVEWRGARLAFGVQGSSANDTAVGGGAGSDVDVAVVWCDDLLPADRHTIFARDHEAVSRTYGELVELVEWAYDDAVPGGGFALRTKAFGPVEVDVVPALRWLDEAGQEGILIPGGLHQHFEQPIVNWPLLHRAAVDAKDRRLGGALRPVVRALKGLRDFRRDGTGFGGDLPSYLLEGLCVAAPDAAFGTDLTTGLDRVLSWSIDAAADHARHGTLTTPDGHRLLFGPEQKWSAPDVRNGLIGLSNVLLSGDPFDG